MNFNKYKSIYKLSFKKLEDYNTIAIYGGGEHSVEDINNINFKIDDLIELINQNNIIIIDYTIRRNSRYRKSIIPEVISNGLTKAIGFKFNNNITKEMLLEYKKTTEHYHLDLNMIDILININHELQ